MRVDRGDRPDTYRHWEIIALNALPISNLPFDIFSQLFGPDMLYFFNLTGISAVSHVLAGLEDCTAGAFSDFHWPLRDKLLVSYWRGMVDAARQKVKGTVLQPSKSPVKTGSCKGRRRRTSTEKKNVPPAENHQPDSLEFILDSADSKMRTISVESQTNKISVESKTNKTEVAITTETTYRRLRAALRSIKLG